MNAVCLFSYGENRATSTNAAVTANPLRYIAGYQEASNLYKLGARYYDATTGRFTQFDPAGQEANPYAYAACNPINSKDPTGQITRAQACGLAWVGIGALAASLILTIPFAFAGTAVAVSATAVDAAGYLTGIGIGIAGVFGC